MVRRRRRVADLRETRIRGGFHFDVDCQNGRLLRGYHPPTSPPRLPAVLAAGTTTRLTATASRESTAVGEWPVQPVDDHTLRRPCPRRTVPTGPITRPVASPATGPEQATVPTLSPVELSGCDVDRINAALTATIAPATRTVYTCVWGIWERWCETRGLCAMPADPAAICAYLAERAEQGVAAGTLTQTLGGTIFVSPCTLAEPAVMTTDPRSFAPRVGRPLRPLRRTSRGR